MFVHMIFLCITSLISTELRNTSKSRSWGFFSGVISYNLPNLLEWMGLWFLRLNGSSSWEERAFLELVLACLISSRICSLLSSTITPSSWLSSPCCCFLSSPNRTLSISSNSVYKNHIYDDIIQQVSYLDKLLAKWQHKYIVRWCCGLAYIEGGL